MAARRGTRAGAVYDAAAAERDHRAARDRTTGRCCGRSAWTVIDAAPDDIAPRLADHYLALKAAGRL